jgi:phosphate transport system permease protein
LINAQRNEEQATVAALGEDNRLQLVNFSIEESMLSDEPTIERTATQIPHNGARITHLLMTQAQDLLYVADEQGNVQYFDIRNKQQPALVDKVSVTAEAQPITSMSFLAGGISILVGDASGRISQWFPLRDENNHYTLEKVREFTDQHAAILHIAPEPARKGFAAIDASGISGIYHTTSGNSLMFEQVVAGKPLQARMAPRSNALLLLDENQQFSLWAIDNEYPEVSWSALWGEVWYESRQEPEYIWQSSSASSDFETKFSLTPLAFGTLKGAMYALLFALPLSIMGAIYTAYFMSPKMRGMVKPTIEVMEALPTVILGFLAGLWLAPLMEENLPGVFCILFLLPLMMLIFAWCWQYVPRQIRQSIPDGWEAALLIPVVCLTAWASIALSQPLELWLFNGDMPAWLNEIGYTFDQRNSLVVGIAMGFAVIPTIFSISEDAIYSVPRHLTQGSLALGATPWQTLIKVVILTASPGIFSGVMIGLGRAVGETMIVLMATGNTPIMDFNIFQGFRALSANIAVEMPESEVGSSHYRILFLAALVLFMVTFVFNTLAELVRQRLRRKYASL